MQEEFLSQQDLAIRWALHVQTLTKWRTLRRGPPFVKLGKIVRYAMSNILEFERNGLSKPVPRRQPFGQLTGIPVTVVPKGGHDLGKAYVGPLLDRWLPSNSETSAP